MTPLDLDADERFRLREMQDTEDWVRMTPKKRRGDITDPGPGRCDICRELVSDTPYCERGLYGHRGCIEWYLRDDDHE